jgi:hypothetical protein
MGCKCGTHGRGEKCLSLKNVVENMEGRRLLPFKIFGLSMDGRVILKCMWTCELDSFRPGYVLVTTVTSLRIPK